MVLGLGTGTTAKLLVDALGRRIRDEKLRITAIATSVRTEQQARALGVTLTSFASTSALDLAIDGADEVEDGTLRLIKGLGGALLREKIVAEAARRFVVVVDASKAVSRLGERAPEPVEVVRFGHEVTARRLAALSGSPVLRAGSDGKPFITDNGNLIYDCHTGPLADPRAFGAALKSIAGVVESGLFLEGVEQVIVGEADGSVRVLRPSH
ncbi:MAG: ribose 5-phosphate isomerase A [Acetobacteraceae bacterium]|nr:ribose 5-phosphate isomerase A [Acetobacteraceae bacterium]